MSEAPDKTGYPLNKQLEEGCGRVNEALRDYSDKDWNYSRISLVIQPLGKSVGPYALSLETLDLNTQQGRRDLKALVDEVKWGQRHSSELAMLEVVSLRINKALLEVTNDEHWQHKRPSCSNRKEGRPCWTEHYACVLVSSDRGSWRGLR